jgi:hypothetical protein
MHVVFVSHDELQYLSRVKSVQVCVSIHPNIWSQLKSIQWGKLQRKVLQRTNATTNIFINKIRILQRTRGNTIGRRSTRVRMTCRAFPLWLERQSSSLWSFVRFRYQFSSVIWLFAPLTLKLLFKLFCYIILAMSRQIKVRKMVGLDGNFAVGCGPGTDFPLSTYISVYARTNRCYNERRSRTNYVRSSILHCT